MFGDAFPCRTGDDEGNGMQLGAPEGGFFNISRDKKNNAPVAICNIMKFNPN